MNEQFLNKADILKPKLLYKQVEAQRIVEILKEDHEYQVREVTGSEGGKTYPMKKHDKVCFDFGRHCVGFISFSVRAVGNPPDNPAHLKIKFGETPCEIAEPFSEYDENLSSSWLQEEFIFVDVLPAVIEMPRRYAFRYVEIEVLDTSFQFQVIIDNVKCNTVTSANRTCLKSLEEEDKELQKIDEVAINTLEGCMQDVFEDGPKRDRRLWIGDLRIEALANYATFQNYNLVKRCLYLFAAAPLPGGKTGGCVYTRPSLIVDKAINLFDYSLFFVSCLYDYYVQTKEDEILQDLWETAYTQLILASEEMDEDNVIIDHPDNWWWCFIDWHTELNKQASAQAVFIYTLKQGRYLAEKRNRQEQVCVLEQLIDRAVLGARKCLWDERRGLFTSGKEKQISWASQIWFALAGILPEEENRKLLIRTKEIDPNIRLITPYMNHCYVEALVKAGMREEAIEYVKLYWGGMVKAGADCFWEVYDINNPELSAYGDRIINSYCHAWSCSPTYFIRNSFHNR